MELNQFCDTRYQTLAKSYYEGNDCYQEIYQAATILKVRITTCVNYRISQANYNYK